MHHHQGTEELAQRVAVLAEHAHTVLVPWFGHTPREKTHVVLADVDDSANGSATSLPYNTIRLNAATPEPRGVLNDFDDFLWILFVHEYAHILHLDTIRGLPDLGNRIFGKQFSPNAAWPAWLVEGLAVHHESKHSGAGRLRSSLHDMELRMHLLEDRAFDFPVLSTSPLEWPRRDGWYLYGGRFLDFMERTWGPNFLRAMSEENAPRVWPYLLNHTARKRTGRSLAVLYLHWLHQERRLAEQVAESRAPLTEEERLTLEGEIRRSPRLSPDGTGVYTLFIDADSRPRLMRFDLRTGEDRTVARLNGDGVLSVMPDGTVLVSQPDYFRTFRRTDDLFVVDPSRGSVRRLTSGARLSEPDVAFDGRVVAIRRNGAGLTELVLFDSLEDAKANGGRVILSGKLGEPLASPRFSPDGTHVVLSGHRNGSWNLTLVSLLDGSVDVLTDDGAQDLTPSFSRDGRKVLFSSDRTGIYDVYAMDLETRAVHRLTRMLGGAFEPLDTDHGLYFIRYGATGYDLARLDKVDPRPAEEAAPQRGTIPHGSLREVADGASGPRPSRPYSPWSTIRPAYWSPTVVQDPAGYGLGVTTTGFDVLRRWQWTASAWYGLASREPGGAIGLRTDAIWPALSLRLQRSVDFVPGFGSHYGEVNLAGRLSANFLFRRRWSWTRLTTGWDVGYLRPASFVDPGWARPTPDRGFTSTALLSFTHSSVRRFVRSISNAEGNEFTLDVRASGPYTGSDFSNVLLAGGWTGYWPMPVRHHVLAVRTTAGVGFGDFGRRAFFALGGPLIGGFQVMGFESRFPFRLLRGYPHGAFAGPGFALANVEYRFPLAAPEAGVSWLPVQLRRLHGAVLTDVGAVFAPENLGAVLGPKVGSGVELRAELTFGYRLQTDLRLGYARGWNGGGVHQLILLLGASY